MRYKEFLLQVAKVWAADKVETDSDTDTDAAHTGTSSQTLVCLMRTLLGEFRVICGNMCQRKLLEVNRVKENILLGGEMFVLPTKKEVKLGTSASSAQCHSTRGNVSTVITPSSTTRVFGEYFLKISVHKNGQRICYKFLKKHNTNIDLSCLNPGNGHFNNLNAPSSMC